MARKDQSIQNVLTAAQDPRRPLVVVIVEDDINAARRIRTCFLENNSKGQTAFRFDVPDTGLIVCAHAQDALAEAWRVVNNVQPFLVIVDVNWNISLPQHNRNERQYYGLSIVYDGMIKEWRQAGGSRPWRHIFVRSRLLGEAETPEHETEIDKFCKALSIPRMRVVEGKRVPDHVFEAWSITKNEDIQILVNRAVELGNEYCQLGGVAGVEFRCGCMV